MTHQITLRRIKIKIKISFLMDILNLDQGRLIKRGILRNTFSLRIVRGIISGMESGEGLTKVEWIYRIQSFLRLLKRKNNLL